MGLWKNFNCSEERGSLVRSTHPTSIARSDLLPKLRKLRVHESEVVLTVGGLPAAQALVVHLMTWKAATLEMEFENPGNGI